MQVLYPLNIKEDWKDLILEDMRCSDEGVKQECTFLLVQNRSSWMINGSAKKEGVGEGEAGKWYTFGIHAIEWIIVQTKISYGMVNFGEWIWK
jgi:hypothetical protein